MKSEWTKPPSGAAPAASVKASIDWLCFRRSFIETLAFIGTGGFVLAITLAFIAWLALMPSIGFLWLVGWL